MRSVVPMRIAKTGYIVLSAALCLFGALLLAMPDLSLTVFSEMVGVAMIAFGVIRIIGYLSKDLYRLAFQYDLAFGGLLVVLGIMVLLRPEVMTRTLFIAIGLSFLTDGLLKIQISLDARSFGIPQWWLILGIAVLSSAAGLTMIFAPAESARFLTMFLGISLILDGALNLITVLLTVKIIRNQFPDKIDDDFLDSSF